MIEQCDFGDNSASLYDYLMTVNDKFLKDDILPRIDALPDWAQDVDVV